MFLHELGVRAERWVKRDIEAILLAQRRRHALRGIARHQHPVLNRMLQRARQLLQLVGRPLNAVKPDEQSQNFIGAFKNAIDARVTQIALVRPRLHEATATSELHEFVGGAPHEFAREHLGARGFE